MENKYQIEIAEFKSRFREYKNKKIVLYGIGRYTATLMEGLTDYSIIGLMDKDSNNIGKTFFGLPVIDKCTVEKVADMVIINTSETYWDIIYNRICDLKIPIFYKNGERAVKTKKEITENPFWKLNYKELCQQIDKAEVVSFDFFDTLFMRSVSNPADVFALMEAEWSQICHTGVTFSEIRNQAKGKIRKNYSLEELYLQIEYLSQLPHAILESFKEKEIELEESQLLPRKEMISALKLAFEKKKEVYIVSDMYLPEEFYRKVLKQYDIVISTGHIWLSHVLDASKADGTIWRYFSARVVRGRRALHIGDNPRTDVEKATCCGIHTYLSPSSWDLLKASSLREVSDHICSIYSSVIAGCILKRLFRDPYILKNIDGKVLINNNVDMGYCVFGPIIFTFLMWLLQESRKDGIHQLVFMSRDGYFLKEDFEYLCELHNKKMQSSYLEISRQLVMTASIESREDLIEYISMPYTGSMVELFEDRLGIYGIKETAGKSISEYIEEYSREIKEYILQTKENYLDYVNKKGLDENSAVVDLGYYGNNQKYLNKLTGRYLSGYYFNANLSEQNINSQNQKMTACFQEKEDLTGEKSFVLKKMIYIESFLTAPCGMVKSIDQEKNFIYAEKKKNQEYFNKKVEINQGVKYFIEDYIKYFGEYTIELDIDFIDWLYGYCIGGALVFSEDVKKSFYNDNAMMNRLESMLFY